MWYRKKKNDFGRGEDPSPRKKTTFSKNDPYAGAWKTVEKGRVSGERNRGGEFILAGQKAGEWVRSKNSSNRRRVKREKLLGGEGIVAAVAVLGRHRIIRKRKSGHRTQCGATRAVPTAGLPTARKKARIVGGTFRRARGTAGKRTSAWEGRPKTLNRKKGKRQ